MIAFDTNIIDTHSITNRLIETFVRLNLIKDGRWYWDPVTEREYYAKLK